MFVFILFCIFSQRDTETEASTIKAEGSASDALELQAPTLEQDVMTSSIDETLEQSDALQRQYIQGSETDRALFYLTGSLQTL